MADFVTVREWMDTPKAERPPVWLSTYLGPQPVVYVGADLWVHTNKDPHAGMWSGSSRSFCCHAGTELWLSPEAAEADAKRRTEYLDRLEAIDSHRRRQQYPEWYCDACGLAHRKTPRTPEPCDDCAAWLENPAELPERFAQE